MTDIQRLAKTRRFKSAPQLLGKSATTPLSIDAEKGIIKNVVMCQAGEAKGHGVFLEQSFIDALVNYDNTNFSNGLKARFDHPGLCDGTMGTQLGKFSNFRVEGDKAVADLQLLDAANLSPKHPQMREWTLKMAQESPDFLMSSIVFAQSGLYQYDADGNKYQLYTIDSKGNYNDQNDYNPEFGKAYVELGQHFYTDLVEAGAATDNLFSEQFNEDKFGVQVIEFFEENTPLLTFLQSNPAKVTEFLSKIGVSLTKSPDDIDDTDLYLQIQTLQTELDSYKNGDVAQKSQIAALTTEKTALSTEITNLQAEVAELREEPAGKPAGGEAAPTPTVEEDEELSAFGSALRDKFNSRR